MQRRSAPLGKLDVLSSQEIRGVIQVRDGVAAHIRTQRVADRQTVRLDENRREWETGCILRIDIIIGNREVQPTGSIAGNCLKPSAVGGLSDGVAVHMDIDIRAAIDVNPNAIADGGA